MRSGSLVTSLICSLSLSLAQADATLEYALTDGGIGTVNKKISISRFFARVDSSDRPDEFLLFQAGKFFPLYRVNTAQGTYTLLTSSIAPERPGGPAEVLPASTSVEGKGDPSAGVQGQGQGQGQGQEEQLPAAPGHDAVATGMPAPADEIVFRPTRKMGRVAGVKCRLVLETASGSPVVEHCMANKAGFGITERESRTLARLFVLARAQGYGWLGAATPDEDFVSVRAKDSMHAGTLELLSVSRSPLEPGYLKIPSEFRQVEASAPPAIPRS